MIYVTSDLHGYPLHSIQRTLDKLGFSTNDKLYILGDCIDRGADSVKILRWAMSQPNVHLILGNHESMMLDNSVLFEGDRILTRFDLRGEQLQHYALWTSNGGYHTINGMQQCTPAQIKYIMRYVERAPLFREVTVNGITYILTHSGLDNFSSEKPLSDYSLHDLVWNRPTMDTAYYTDGRIVIFGHTPTSFLSTMHRGKPIYTDTWIDIDVGASLGNKPLLLRLDDMQEFYME